MNQRTWLEWRPGAHFQPGNMFYVFYVLNTQHMQPDVTRIHLKTSQFQFFSPVFVLFEPLSVSGDQSKGQPQPKHTLIINLLSLVNHSHTHTHTLQGLRPANICRLHLYEHAGRENRIHPDESEQPWQACTLLSIVVVLVVAGVQEVHMTVHHHRSTMEDSEAGRVSALQLKTRYLLPWLHVQTHNREKYSTHPGNVHVQDAFSSQ